MRDLLRFGRRLPIPSTAQIVHELKVMILRNRIKELENESASLAAHHADNLLGEGEACENKSQVNQA